MAIDEDFLLAQGVDPEYGLVPRNLSLTVKMLLFKFRGRHISEIEDYVFRHFHKHLWRNQILQKIYDAKTNNATHLLRRPGKNNLASKDYSWPNANESKAGYEIFIDTNDFVKTKSFSVINSQSYTGGLFRDNFYYISTPKTIEKANKSFKTKIDSTTRLVFVRNGDKWYQLLLKEMKSGVVVHDVFFGLTIMEPSSNPALAKENTNNIDDLPYNKRIAVLNYKKIYTKMYPRFYCVEYRSVSKSFVESCQRWNVRAASNKDFKIKREKKKELKASKLEKAEAALRAPRIKSIGEINSLEKDKK